MRRPIEDLGLRRLSWENAALRFHVALLRRLSFERRYNADQPRRPAGSPGGGQWTPGGASDVVSEEQVEQVSAPRTDRSAAPASGWRTVDVTRNAAGAIVKETVVNSDGVAIRSEYPAPGSEHFDERHTVLARDGTIRSFETKDGVQTIYDNDWRRLSATAWTSDGPQQVETVESADFTPSRGGVKGYLAQKTAELGASLYTFLSGGNGPNQQAVFAFRANAYQPGETPLSIPTWIGSLTRDEVKESCPRFEDVQRLINLATNTTDRSAFDNAALFGTAVHKNLKDLINGPNAPPDPVLDWNFRSEVSISKSKDAKYGEAESIGVDVLENVRNGTVCVYDIKTGWSRLSFWRSSEIAFNVHKYYSWATNIIVTEVRAD